MTLSLGERRRSFHQIFTSTGRPITPEDVLAVDCATVGGCGGGFVLPSGLWRIHDPYTGSISAEAEWVLEKPLEEQSPETIEFIGSVLSV